MEQRLEPALRALLPGSVVVGEESAAADPARLRLLEGEDPAWLIDPLDGTANFAAGSPVFGSMVCLVERGETLAAWIYHPATRQMLVANEGRRLARWQGMRIITTGVPLRASIITKFFPSPLRTNIELVRGRFEEREPNHCAAATYTELVSGDLEVAMYYRLMPWDHAPGVLIHAEAGGFSTRFNGEPYSVTAHTGGLLLAPVEAVWLEISQAFTAAS